MISCTEFIPAYSELFTFLEDKHGKEEITRFWTFLFEPTGDKIPLINFLRKEGIRGCYSYWTGTLSEEASDTTIYLNEKAGWFMNIMHNCPSKGRLLKFKDELGITPYHNYCQHCDCYRSHVELAGLKYIYNFIGEDKATCRLFVYDPKVFNGQIIVDENTEIMDIRAAEKEYFHPDFHSSMNNGIDYLGENFGEEEVVAYLRDFVKHVYHPVTAAIKESGLAAIEKKILDTYAAEKCPDAVKTVLTDDALTVEIAYCPAVKHLLSTGREVSKWFPYTSSVVMEELAAAGGYTFCQESYDEATGAAVYRFSK